jgi:hypothetical protein
MSSTRVRRGLLRLPQRRVLKYFLVASSSSLFVRFVDGLLAPPPTPPPTTQLVGQYLGARGRALFPASAANDSR